MTPSHPTVRWNYSATAACLGLGWFAGVYLLGPPGSFGLQPGSGSSWSMWPLPILSSMVGWVVAVMLRPLITRPSRLACVIATILLPLIGGALYAFVAQAILVLAPSVFQGSRIYSFYASPAAWALTAAAVSGRLLVHGFYLALPLSALSCFSLRRAAHRPERL